MAEHGSALNVRVAGLDSMNTTDIPSLIRDGQVAFAENMISSNGGFELRRGTKVFKSAAQWGAVSVIAGASYKLGTSNAEVVFILSDGKVYYKAISAISATPTTVFNPTVSYTLLTTLSISDPNEVFIEVIDDKVIIVDGTNMVKYYGSDHVIKSAPDPVGFELTMTVGSGVAATIDATYKDASDATKEFNVELTKTAGTGTSLVLRQTAGSSRPAATGTLTKLTGTGDSSINWTATAYSEEYISMGKRDARIALISDIGEIILGHPNDGTNYYSSQVERIPYGKVDSLKVTNVTDFKRGTVLSLSQPELRKSATAILTGYRKYDTDTPERTDGLFKTDRESNMLAILGRSGLEVGNGFIGLTRNGFIDFAALQSSTEFGITDSEYISNDIRSIVRRVNWDLESDIRACIDEVNQRYWCAVPVEGSTGNTLVFVYDFSKSTEAYKNFNASRKWSLFTFNIGDATISSLFNLFGHPCMGLSDGRVLMAEIEDYYSDPNGNYPSSIITKTHDFDNRTHLKAWESGILDMKTYLPEGTEAAEFVVIPITDGNYRTTNWGKKSNTNKVIHPRTLDLNDNWTTDVTDLWSLNPFDVWNSTLSSDTPVQLTSVPNFKEIALLVGNRDGGIRWGIYGYEINARVGDLWTDSRRVTTNKTLSQNSGL